MDDPMIRLALFAVVTFGVVAYLRWTGARGRVSPVKVYKPKKRKTEAKPGNAFGADFWDQVYDTDSEEDARRLREKFLHLGIHCLVYQQGKKDVYGNTLKRFGISVPHDSVEKAQTVLLETTL